MNNQNLLIALASCLLAPLAVLAEPSSKKCNSPTTVIESVRLFDGLEIRPVATVVIQCSLIEKVLDDPSEFQAAEDAIVVDGRGKTLVPGLIDAHVHAWRRGQLERALHFGVTMKLDMGSSRGLALEMRAEEARGENITDTRRIVQIWKSGEPFESAQQ
ncbi:MAG: hypothetical protein HKN15_13105 [Xanthomonadales bacterium]|nr:hypothetical protein [Xanthomonadales bacterium]